MGAHRSHSEGFHASRWRCGACAPTILIVFLTALPGRAVDLVFRDGFESCDGSAWSSAPILPDCSTPLDCPSPAPGQACVAGRFRSTENNAAICVDPVSAAVCTGIGTGGPCALRVEVADGLAFLSNPGAASPIAVAERVIDGCGRFRLSGFAVPATGFAAVYIDDATGAADLHLLTAEVVAVASQDQLEGQRGYVLRHEIDAAWTVSAGAPFGTQTFAERGVFVPIFLHGEIPVAGVTVTASGAPRVDDDFYFSDLDPDHRTTVSAAQASTGANGSALLVDSTLETHSGSGSEPPGCAWPTTVAATAAGLALVQELRAEVLGGGGGICP